MNFAEAVRQCVDTMGAGVVRDSRRFVSCLLDYADDSLALRAAARNLDDAVLAPFVEALDAGDDADSLDLAAAKVEVTLRNERGLEASVAHDIASAIGEALSVVLAPPPKQGADAQDVPAPQPEPKPSSQQDAPYVRPEGQTVVEKEEPARGKSGLPSRNSLLSLAAVLSLLSAIVLVIYILLLGDYSAGLLITVLVDVVFAVCAFKRPRGFEKVLVAVAAYHFALFCNMIIQLVPYLSLTYFSPLALLSFGATACLYVAFLVASIGPQRFRKVAAIVATIGAAIAVLQGLSSLAYALGGTATTESALANNSAEILLYAALAVASWAIAAPGE